MVLVNNCRGRGDRRYHISDHSGSAVVRLLALDRAGLVQPVLGSSFLVVEWKDLMRMRELLYIRSRTYVS